MSLESTTRTVAQLAETRQAIAQYWAQEARSESPSGGEAKNNRAAPAIPTVLAGLALIAVAEKLLLRATPLRKQAQDFPIFKIAQTLLQSTAQNHPGGLVAGATLLGGCLAAARPWRWLKCADLLPHLLTQLTAVALAHAQDDSA